MAPSTRRIISPICVNSGSSPSATGSRCFVPPNGYNYKDLLKRLKIAGREINRALGQALPFLTLSPRSCTSLTIFTVIRRPGLHPPDLIEARLCQHSQYVSRNIKHNSHADPKQPPCHHPIQAFPSPVDTSRENINGLPTQEEGGFVFGFGPYPGYCSGYYRNCSCCEMISTAQSVYRRRAPIKIGPCRRISLVDIDGKNEHRRRDKRSTA